MQFPRTRFMFCSPKSVSRASTIFIFDSETETSEKIEPNWISNLHKCFCKCVQVGNDLFAFHWKGYVAFNETMREQAGNFPHSIKVTRYKNLLIKCRIKGKELATYERKLS